MDLFDLIIYLENIVFQVWISDLGNLYDENVVSMDYWIFKARCLKYYNQKNIKHKKFNFQSFLEILQSLLIVLISM